MKNPVYFTPTRSTKSCPKHVTKKNSIRTPIRGKELFPETPEKKNKELICPGAPRRENNHNYYFQPPLVAFPFSDFE